MPESASAPPPRQPESGLCSPPPLPILLHTPGPHSLPLHPSHSEHLAHPGTGGWIVAPCSGLGSVFRGVLRLGAPGAFPALIPCSLPLPPSPPHRLRAAAAVPCRGRLGGGKDGEGWMLAGREPRQIPDNSCPGKWKRWEGKGGRLSRPGFPNAFALGGPGTKGRSAGVRGGEQKPSARVSASGVRA